MVWALHANAQLGDMFSFSTSNQQVVRDAVEKCFVEVTSHYRLEDLQTHKQYGRDGHDTFGATTSWGVRVRGGYIVLGQATRPWDFDEIFSKFRGKYGTVPCGTDIDDNGERSHRDSLNAQPCGSHDLLYFVGHGGQPQRDGLEVDYSEGEKDGWFVWLTAEVDSLESFLVVRHKMEGKYGKSVHEVEQPNTKKRVVAGIFVTPSYPSIGVVNFRLSGVLLTQEDKWLLAVPDGGDGQISADPKGEETVLTPVESDAKDNPK